MNVLAAFLPLAITIADMAPADYWDWQLTDPYDLSVNVEILVIEPDDHSAEDIRALATRGVEPVCYISVGSWENFRDDAGAFPESVLGKTMGEWPDERYVDMRQLTVLLPLMGARISTCAAKGFKGVEFDNMGAYDNDTGFAITKLDALAYFDALADHAKRLGLSVAQKNVPELVPDLVDKFDFVIVEQCFRYEECEAFQPYLDMGKHVLAVEYVEDGRNWDAACSKAKMMGIALLLKEKEVVAGGLKCR
ncbi:MAG: endo alpha-1,4 polygalactosaminidase [Pseudomonadota bacterium]